MRALEPEVEAATREVIRRGTVQLNLRVDRRVRSTTTASTPRCWKTIAGNSSNTRAATSGNDPLDAADAAFAAGRGR